MTQHSTAWHCTAQLSTAQRSTGLAFQTEKCINIIGALRSTAKALPLKLKFTWYHQRFLRRPMLMTRTFRLGSAPILS